MPWHKEQLLQVLLIAFTGEANRKSVQLSARNYALKTESGYSPCTTIGTDTPTRGSAHIGGSPELLRSLPHHTDKAFTFRIPQQFVGRQPHNFKLSEQRRHTFIYVKANQPHIASIPFWTEAQYVCRFEKVCSFAQPPSDTRRISGYQSLIRRRMEPCRLQHRVTEPKGQQNRSHQFRHINGTA